jgi:hypothetical protein
MKALLLLNFSIEQINFLTNNRTDKMTKEQYKSIIFSNENQFQAATFRYINNNYPKTRGLCFHVPNESASSDIMRMKLSAMGVVSGIPDIVFVSPVFGLELKMPKGKQSDKQKHIQNVWESNGIPYYLCRNAEEVLSILENVLI